MEEWDKVSWLAFFIPRFTKKRYKFEDFHPFRGRLKSVNIFELNKRIDEVRKNLPKNLTNAEIDALWEEHKRKGKRGKDARS